MQTRSQKKHVPAAQVHVGDHFGFSTYGVVTGAASDKFDVRTNTGEEWTISKNIFPQKIYSASWFGETHKVTRTEMAALLHNAGQEIFSVTFTKAGGEKRTLVGHLVETEELFGRAMVVDLEIEPTAGAAAGASAGASANNLRQVDYRTLEELVLCGVKYTLR